MDGFFCVRVPVYVSQGSELGQTMREPTMSTVKCHGYGIREPLQYLAVLLEFTQLVSHADSAKTPHEASNASRASINV